MACARPLIAGIRRFVLILFLVAGTGGEGVRGAEAFDLDVGEVTKHFAAGRYAQVIDQAGEAVRDGLRDEEWSALLARACLAVGRLEEARAALTNGLARYRSSIRLRLLGHEVFQVSGDAETAQGMLEEIGNLGRSRLWAYRDPPNLVTLGRAFLRLGADPKKVLENFYDQAKRADPELRDVPAASGELALAKHDYALAAKIYGEALKKFPDDPEFQFGLARAHAPADRGAMLERLERVFAVNSNHCGARVLLAEHLVDAEEYGEAETQLGLALKVNPLYAEAWAYRAVLAHLRSDAAGEASARSNALRFWTNNPAVDHWIGRKLSQKYRFAEGEVYQRRALAMDPGFLPAKIQLAQDLLRLGREEEGWALAREVNERDGYDVNAFNLVGLQETLEKFRTLTNGHFVVRMEGREARLYGSRVLALLERARESLTRKYGLELTQPVLVEIFPDQKDFGVRTFGMPDNPGFLGVCFGHVITANSPASAAGHASNWEAVLWHEFCHVVTLQLTRNKMPRWLSEGISVYEELQENPAWGQHMDPRYREMILGEDLQPVSELSPAFLSPKSDLHLQFAYFQSALVVEFLVERHGLEKLKAILRDLGEGREINAAIEAQAGSMAQVDRDFAAYARQRAESLAPGLDFTRPKQTRLAAIPEAGGAARSRPRGASGSEPLPSWAATNYWMLADRASALVEEKRWKEALEALEPLVRLYPGQRGPDSALRWQATAHRELGEAEREREVLTRWASIDAEALEAYERLMELGEKAGEWGVVSTNAQRFLAVNPLLPAPHLAQARSAEQMGDGATAVAAYERVLLLDPPNAPEIHHRLARLLKASDPAAARRHVLLALEEAPRYREALALLLELGPSNP